MACDWAGAGVSNSSKLWIIIANRAQVKPMGMSRHFCHILKYATNEAIALLEAKRLYDRNIAFLLRIIHGTFFEDLANLRHAMVKVRGNTGTVLKNGWTSCFPCVAFGLNRQTPLHRDSKGCRGGLDIISVFGNFTGGHFRLQDLNVVAEWQPGCLGALDGYDLAHEVLQWEGTHRVTLISFCRGSAWRGLKVDRDISHPKLSKVIEDLVRARLWRKASMEETFGATVAVGKRSCGMKGHEEVS
jgi:hypothetical protein